MQQRRLGSSGFEISTIGLGTWAIGGHMWGGQDDAHSVEAVHAAVEHGVNWIDTAPLYGSGHSERVVGRAVRQLPNGSRPMIFTKFGMGADGNAANRSAAAADVSAECDASLQLAASGGLSVPQLCVGVLLQTTGLTGVIGGGRNARQGGLIANLGVNVTPDQAAGVWAVAEKLAKDLA